MAEEDVDLPSYSPRRVGLLRHGGVLFAICFCLPLLKPDLTLLYGALTVLFPAFVERVWGITWAYRCIDVL